MGEIMDEIDYKQVSNNVLKLLDNKANQKSIDCYVNWELKKHMFWHSHYKYELLCDIMRFLELPEPTEEEWKNR